MLALIAMLRRASRRQMKRQALLRALVKNRVRRPQHAPRPIVWRGNRQPGQAAITPHARPLVTGPRIRSEALQLPDAARIVCRPAPPLIENVPALAEAPPALPMDDINHAYGEESASIMREFALRLAGARNQGERRAIKSARKIRFGGGKGESQTGEDGAAGGERGTAAGTRPASAATRTTARLTYNFNHYRFDPIGF
jgi:hypothetical protein